jgi:hypothetical protein
MIRQNKAEIVEQSRNILSPRRKARQAPREEMNYFTAVIHHFSPNFAALASLREIFRRVDCNSATLGLVETLHRLKYQQGETLQ